MSVYDGGCDEYVRCMCHGRSVCKMSACDVQRVTQREWLGRSDECVVKSVVMSVR